MTDLLYFDGVDAETLGLSLREMPGQWNAPEGGYQSVEVPLLDGAFLSSDRRRTGARTLNVVGLINRSTTTLAETALATLHDAINDRLVEITFSSTDDRALYGVLQTFAAELTNPLHPTGMVTVRMSFLCPDPYAVELTPTTLSGAATVRIPITVGTGPTYPSLQITGAATNPTITLRNHLAQAVATIATTVTLATEDALLIETVDGGDVTLSDNAVLSDGTTLLNAGYQFPVVRPTHANRAAASWPTLETSQGTLAVTWVRRWR